LFCESLNKTCQIIFCCLPIVAIPGIITSYQTKLYASASALYFFNGNEPSPADQKVYNSICFTPMEYIMHKTVLYLLYNIRERLYFPVGKESGTFSVVAIVAVLF
jgi:hypothetical protein